MWIKAGLIFTGYLPDVHEPAEEAGVGEQQLKHFVRADVEDLVQIDSTLHLGRTHSLLHWGNKKRGWGVFKQQR